MKSNICPLLDSGKFTIHCFSGYPGNVGGAYKDKSLCQLWDPVAGRCGLLSVPAVKHQPAPVPAKKGFLKWFLGI